MAIRPAPTGQQTTTSWELKQLVKSGLYANERMALRAALRAYFQAKPQAKLKIVASAYQAGEISLGRAAAMLAVSQEEAKEILREAGGQIHLGPLTPEEALEDARNA